MTPQTYDSLDGRMIHREGRTGQYVKLSDYEALEKRHESGLVAIKIPDGFATSENIAAAVKTANIKPIAFSAEMFDRSYRVAEAWNGEPTTVEGPVFKTKLSEAQPNIEDPPPHTD